MKPTPLASLALSVVLGSCVSDGSTFESGTTGRPVVDTRSAGSETGATAPDSGHETHVSSADPTEPPSTEVDRAPIPARCNALASMRCEGSACDATRAWQSVSLRRQRGRVSYYADALHGRRTASGDPYDRTRLTAASRTLPFGALVRIRRADRPDQRVVVRINDRGPFGRGGRILDLSRAAAECIDMIRAGVVEVEAEVIDWGPRGAP